MQAVVGEEAPRVVASYLTMQRARAARTSGVIRALRRVHIGPSKYIFES
jgi:hypothetical protein